MLSPQVNTTMPARTLLFCWGPYAILCLCATVMDMSTVSPKLLMVRPTLTPGTSSSLSQRPALSLALHSWCFSVPQHCECTGSLSSPHTGRATTCSRPQRLQLKPPMR